MKNISLVKLLYAGLIVGFLVTLLMSVTSIWQLFRTVQIAEELIEHPFVVTNTVRDIRVDARSLWEIATKAAYQDIYTDDMAKQIPITEEKIVKELEIVKAQYLGSPADVGHIDNVYRKLKETIHQAISIRNDKGAKSAAGFLNDNNAEQLYYQLSNEVNDVLRYAFNETKELKIQAHHTLQEGITKLIILSLLVLILGLAVSLILMKYIRQKFGEIGATVESIKNDSYTKVAVEKYDLLEFSTLKEAINKMVDGMTESRATIEDQNEEVTLQYETLRTKTLQLEISEEKFRQIFENMSSGVVVYEATKDGRDFIIKNFNSSAERIESLKREQVLERRLSEMFPAVEEFGFLQALREAYESGKPQNFPIGFYKDDRISGWRENFIYKLSTGEIVVIYNDVTQLKLVEENLQIAERRLNLAMEFSDLGVWDLDITHDTVWRTLNHDLIFGFTSLQEEWSAKVALQHVVPEDQEWFKHCFEEAFRTGKFFLECRIIHPDKSVHWISACGKVVYDENGRPERMLGTVADITERKLLEHSLEASQKQYKAITEQNIACVYVMQDGMLSYVNEAFVKVLGYDSADEIINKIPVSNFVLASEQDKVNEKIRKRFDGEIKSAHYETVFLRKDGVEVAAEVHGVIGEYNDRPAIIGVLIDKTERKKADDFRTLLLSSLGDGVFGIDTDGKCTFINNSALQMLGLELDEVLGFNQHELFHHHHRDGQLYPEPECPIYKTALDGAVRDIEEVFIRKDGRYFDVHLKVAPMIILDKIAGVVVVFQDVTEHKMLEENLRSINKNLYHLVKEETDKRVENEKLLMQQSKMAAMGEMIGAIAHQWRQPLNSLAITVQDVPIAYSFGELNEEYLSHFKQETMDIIRSMSSTIDDFRNFFSPNKKQEEFFVEDAVNEVLKIMSSQLKLNNINIIFDSDESGRHAYTCYKNELKQALLNILANAKDALLEAKRANSFVKIDIAKTDKSLTISIEDSAGGIPENIMDKIFEPHFTTKSADKGTGIGLYMSKEIVENSLNGKLTVENTQNGAKFTMELSEANS